MVAAPVWNPQTSGASIGSGASGGTRTAAAASTSTRVAKEDCPKKWAWRP